MDPQEKFALPFLTRKMLSFEHGVAFDLELNTIATDSGILNIIGATREGIFKFRAAPAGDGSAETFIFRIPDVPIFVTVFTNDISVERGDDWVFLFLRAGSERILKLASGYVSKQSGLNWPASQSESELSGGGKFKTVQGSNPVAGAECTITVPTSEHWILKGFHVELVTDATVATRLVHLTANVFGGSVRLNISAGNSQAASLTRQWHFAPDLAQNLGVQDNDIFISLPQDLHLKAAATITTETTALQAGDNFGVPTAWVEQYIEQ